MALAGFFSYNGMTFERFAWAFIKSQFLCAGPRVFRACCAVLNALPTDAAIKITINNRRLNREYNAMLIDKAAESNNLVQDKYITVAVAGKSVEEARTYFHRVDADLSKNLGRLDSGARLLDNHERLRILHDFFRPGEEQYFRFDLSRAMRLGHDFRDYICPDGM